MSIKNYLFADIPVSISTFFTQVHFLCEQYLTEDKPLFSISASAQDIEAERNFFDANNPPPADGLVTSPAYLETLTVQRKLTEALIDYETILFHSSALAMDGQGYLFTALSGTGKSTHSRLWREYFGDRVTMINDDKPFIRIGETESRVYGSPWDGKHHLSTNMSVPIKAICILERDTANHIEPISADDAFAILYQQTYRSKDPAKLVKTIDLLTRMSSQVKLYRLGCNMEPDAARVSYEGMNHE